MSNKPVFHKKYVIHRDMSYVFTNLTILYTVKCKGEGISVDGKRQLGASTRLRKGMIDRYKDILIYAKFFPSYDD